MYGCMHILNSVIYGSVPLIIQTNSENTTFMIHMSVLYLDNIFITYSVNIVTNLCNTSSSNQLKLSALYFEYILFWDLVSMVQFSEKLNSLDCLIILRPSLIGCPFVG